MISYEDNAAGITSAQLVGFFVGWPNPPSPATHLRILRGSAAVELAIDDARQIVVGFVTAIGDGVSCAYIPHLEVLPEYQGRGIGTALMRRMLDRLRDYYMVDLLCDEAVQPFYARLGMAHSVGMFVRRYDRQAGIPAPREAEEGA